jgi:oxygen-independent coproporphyrinogen-3 oxidase
MIVETLNNDGYEHYEISNFSKPGQRSLHNSNYWKGIPYLGLGPSAHSFNGNSRQWNISNNQLYTKSIEQGMVPFEIENIDEVTAYNEYMMISLRLLEGVEMEQIEKRFGSAYSQHTKDVLETFLVNGKIKNTPKGFTIAKDARFLADGIASDFFIV